MSKTLILLKLRKLIKMYSEVSIADSASSKWRNFGVRRDRQFEPLIKKLYSDSNAIFKHLKDIMVLAALIGYSEGKSEPLEGSNTIPITLHTYENDDQDSFIYLLALLSTKNTQVLENENLTEAIKIFEGYCNAGLRILNGWVNEEPSRLIEDILLDKIYRKIVT